MFEPLRDALRGFSARLDPDERRQMTHAMRDALVHAKLGLSDLRASVAATEARLSAERAELETVLRRQGLAAQVDDQETVAIAERFALQHQERVSMLETKRMVQQHELAIAEREYADMSAELRTIMSGMAPNQRVDLNAPADDSADGSNHAFDGSEMADSLSDPMTAPTRRTRAEKEANAEERLAELKRRMGK